MTTQESFKRRIRARMATTGERYNAARRALIAKAAATNPTGRSRVAEPEASDDTIRARTGRGWDEWVDLVDAGPGPEAGHTAVAAWLVDEQGLDGWWAQSVTVGYERITGLRLPGQMSDGTFTVSRTRTLQGAADDWRGLLLDDQTRDGLVPGMALQPRSRAGVKSPRFGLADAATDESLGVLLFSLDEAGDDRTRLTVTHEQLPDHVAAEVWKDFWADWLGSLAAS